MLKTLLVANRGEIAIRIMRAGGGARAPHRRRPLRRTTPPRCTPARPTSARSLEANGPAAYLDIERVLQLAAETRAPTPSTPATGSSARTPHFAARCAEAGITFVGPSPEVLALFGDKAAARALAERLGVPVLRGTPGGITVDEAAAFLRRSAPAAR